MGILWFNLCLGLKHPEGPQSKDTTCIGKSKHTRPQIMGIVETLHMFFFSNRPQLWGLLRRFRR